MSADPTVPAVPAVTAYLFATERQERNGKWRVRGIEALESSTPERGEMHRYKGPLLQADGPTFEAACEEAMRKFYIDPSMRPYLVQMIKQV